MTDWTVVFPEQFPEPRNEMGRVGLRQPLNRKVYREVDEVIMSWSSEQRWHYF